jgi:hypothetical protein
MSLAAKVSELSIQVSTTTKALQPRQQQLHIAAALPPFHAFTSYYYYYYY